MKSQTRILEFIQEFFFKTKKNFVFFQTNFSISLFFLLIGFLSGNLFGTFLDKIRHFVTWDGLIVLGLILFFEIISYLIYHKQGRSFLFLWNFPLSLKKKLFWRSLNYMKIGVMLGFFVDAFKVGS